MIDHYDRITEKLNEKHKLLEGYLSLRLRKTLSCLPINKDAQLKDVLTIKEVSKVYQEILDKTNSYIDNYFYDMSGRLFKRLVRELEIQVNGSLIKDYDEVLAQEVRTPFIRQIVGVRADILGREILTKLQDLTINQYFEMDMKKIYHNLALERGFEHTMSSGDMQIYYYNHINGLQLRLNLETGHFKLTVRQGVLELSTHEVGSFELEEHYAKFYKEMIYGAIALKHGERSVGIEVPESSN